MTVMNWFQLRITIERSQAELLCDHLSDVGAVAVTLEDAAHDPLYEPGPGETPLWPETEITGLFDSEESLHQGLSQLRARVAGESLPEYRVERLADRDWELEWRNRYEPIDCGHGLWICPDGFTVPEAQATVVRMQPGLAFGSGTHPTTALCLRWIAERDLRGAQVVDFGCGSGILGIAALRRGAERVCAIDHEPQALSAAAENATRNQVGDRLTAFNSLDGLGNDFDVLLANVLMNPLVELVKPLASLLRADGKLVLSGLLDTQVDAVWAVYQPWFAEPQVESRDGWARLSAQRSN